MKLYVNTAGYAVTPVETGTVPPGGTVLLDQAVADQWPQLIEARVQPDAAKVVPLTAVPPEPTPPPAAPADPKEPSQ